ncbi:MAG: hypothetical protein CM1200mP18_07880 [Gammaproteobacteria bacterium]|nr:MAG: hypothetical protein CM1200mP18_07880 [Gammaproteobacteria bacterium]
MLTDRDAIYGFTDCYVISNWREYGFLLVNFAVLLEMSFWSSPVLPLLAALGLIRPLNFSKTPGWQVPGYLVRQFRALWHLLRLYLA